MNREMLINKGLAKYEMFENEFNTFFFRSILAGLYLGVSVIFSYTLGSMLAAYYPAVIAKIAIAFTFGIGLVAIYLLGGDLFTGNCFSGILSVYAGRTPVTKFFKMLAFCYIGNFIGMFVICSLFVFSGVNIEYVEPYFETLMEAKKAIPTSELFIRGILANFVVCMGSLAGSLVKTEIGKISVMILLVAAFVLPGFEHSIANMGIFTIGFEIAGGSLAWVPLHMFLSTTGNIIGGSILLGFPAWMMTKVSDGH